MTLGQLYHTVFDFERSQQAYQEGFALWQRVEEEQARSRCRLHYRHCGCDRERSR